MHQVLVEVQMPYNNSGNATGNYNISTPNIEISFTSFAATMNNGTTDVFKVYMLNNGSEAIYNVSVNFTKNGSTSCTTLNATTNAFFGNITPGRTELAWDILISTGDSACTDRLTFIAGGMSAQGSTYNTSNTYRTVDVVLSSESGNGDDDGGTSGSGTSSSATCTSDSDCSALYFCNATSYCEKIECSNGFISEHNCINYVYGIQILSYEPIYALLGSSGSGLVNISNTGNTTVIKTELNLTGGVTGSVIPSYATVGELANYTFNVTVSVPNTTSIGNHSAVLTVYKSDNTTISDSVSLIVVALPNEERISEITLSFEGHLADARELEAEFEAVKAGGFVSIENTSVTGKLINITKAIVSEIEAAISSGDYVGANRLIKDLEMYMEDARISLDKLKLEQEVNRTGSQGGLIMWIIIGIVLAAVGGFMVYMFLPASSGISKYSTSKAPPKPGIGNALKSFRKPKPVSSRLKNYAMGYDKHRGFKYDHKEGIGSKLKKLFKRK